MFKKFNDSPASHELAAAFKRSVVLIDSEGWGRERFLTGLRQIAAFPWRVSDLEGGRMLDEGPAWWRDQALREGVACIEEKDIQAETWNAAAANGLRLKSTWIRVLGFPLKLWHRIEFEKLIDDFGVLLEIDQATVERTSFTEAKLQIGVRNQGEIPVSMPIQFRTDRGEWCWYAVRIIIEQPGGVRSEGNKRKRIWIRKPDPPAGDPEPGVDDENQEEGVEGDQVEDGEDGEWDDADFSEEGGLNPEISYNWC